MKITKSQLKRIIKEELSDHAQEMASFIMKKQGVREMSLQKAVSKLPDIQKVIEKYPEAVKQGFYEAALDYQDLPATYRNLEGAYQSLLSGFSQALGSRREYSFEKGEQEYFPAIDQKLSEELWDKWLKITGA